MTPSTHGSEKKKRSTRPRRRFDHLGPEAVAAFVDGEMSRKSAHNARVHLVLCDNCRADVHRQRKAAQALRNCNHDDQVQASESLLDSLRRIAAETDNAAKAKQANGMRNTNSAGLRASEQPGEATVSGANNGRVNKQPELLERIEKLARAMRRNHSD
ncbi:anti-sigma factor [Corynebacterium sp. MNWGS58]|uniref:hypothetical protein n=1 Tax=Corynebacterium sp. 102791.4 TaxID=3104612 RepID=UPI003511C6E0